MVLSGAQPPGYQLGFHLGSGGMAVVRYGRRVAPGGFVHAVAIKELHPHLASNPELVSMFLDEARLAARVVHPNVVSVLDVVAHGGHVWSVMQYVEGDSLARLAWLARERGERAPVGVAIAIALDLLSGLDAAHRATDERGQPLGIVHRDVSPQNVLVGVDGIARVLDFGVAKARGRLHETRDGQVKGKLAYMAPEQLGGEANASTDVYAAAIVLWELLAGRRLFEAETELELIGRVLEGARTAPSAFARGISPAVDAVVTRALSPDPHARFGSASDMMDALLGACGAPATRTDVAAWVTALAADALATRRALAARMADEPAPGAETSAACETIAPVAATVILPASRRTPPAHARRATRVGLAAAVALVAGVLGVASTANGLAAPTRAAPPSPRSASVIGASFAPSLVTTRVSPEPPRRTLPAPPRAPSAPPPPVAAPAAAPASAPPDPCDPPFVVDAMGVRHYKRACIR